MTPWEEAEIRRWSDTLERPVQTVVALADDARSVKLRKFCEALTHIAPQVTFRTEPQAPPALPHIRLTRRMRFCGLPSGHQLPLLLRMLAGSASAEGGPSAAESGEAITHLMLFVAPDCMHCPRVAEALWRLVAREPGFELELIDVAMFADLAEARSVQAVPTLLVEGRWRLTGAVSEQELVALLQDSRQLGAASLARLLEQGNLEALVSAMCQHQALCSGLPQLLADDNFSTRLAAMALADRLVAEQPSLAAGLAEPVWKHFDQASDAVRGDLLYLLGQLGNPKLVPHLKVVAEGDFGDEVKEAAREALEMLSER